MNETPVSLPMYREPSAGRAGGYVLALAVLLVVQVLERAAAVLVPAPMP